MLPADVINETKLLSKSVVLRAMCKPRSDEKLLLHKSAPSFCSPSSHTAQKRRQLAVLCRNLQAQTLNWDLSILYQQQVWISQLSTQIHLEAQSAVPNAPQEQSWYLPQGKHRFIIPENRRPTLRLRLRA